nr:Crp/Fnr family transcriptional regulator [Seohaeicola saemankumensis]
MPISHQTTRQLHRPCAFCAIHGCSFRCLDPDGRHQRELDLDRGERLENGDSGTCLKFWVVLRGTAATCTTFADGRRQILSLETPGDIVCGLMAGHSGQIWLEALSACRICELDLTPEAQTLRHDADFLAATFGVIHKRLERSQAHISTLGRLDSRERVLLFLAQMASSTATGLVTLPMSREDIADYLGLNAETVSRILSRFKKSGVVKFLSPTEYVLPDMGEVARRLPVPLPVPPAHAQPPHLAPSQLERPA